MARKPCVRCELKLQQWPTDMCVSCQRLTGTWKSTRQREAEALERRRAQRPQSFVSPQQEPPAPEPRRVVIIDGREFEIAWDGSRK